MPYIIALAAALLDQFTKALAAKKLAGGTIPVINGIFHFTYVENTGAAFGVFKDGNTVLAVVMSIIIIGIIIALTVLKPRSLLVRISTGLVMGGAIGNLFDRIFRGFVIDFLDLRAISYPVFNFADSCVVIGAVLICIYIVFFGKKKEEKNADV